MNSDSNSNETRITTALLLAAGTGSRLLPLTKESPKCLTLVSGVSILARLVENLRLQGFKKLVVVTGHLSSIIKDFLGTKCNGMDVEYIHSPLYKTTNNIYSLWTVREKMTEPFVLIESDLVFDSSLLDEMVYPDRLAVASIADWMNGTTVITDDNNKVLEFNRDVLSIDNKIKYKTVNIYSFSCESWRKISIRLDEHIAQGKVNGYYETVFAELVNENSLSLESVSFDEKSWYEIDTSGDLVEAVKLFPTSSSQSLNKTEIKISKNEIPLDANLSMVSFIADLPNICTLFGLLCSTLGIYFAITGQVYFAVIGMVWAVFFDWLDGLIASKLKNRIRKHREFGAQLDSLIDIVSFGVLPATILLSYGEFNPWFLPGAFMIIAACAIRLSYFNIFGLTNGKYYTGLPVDNNGLIIALAFLFENQFSREFFSLVLYMLIIITIIFNLSSYQIPKFSKKAIYGVVSFCILVTVYLGI